MKVTVLGCGSSMGVPAAGGFWGRCDPAEPKNTRSRASILVQSDTTNILVDTTTDLRDHLNRHPVKKLDAALMTHEHSDHIGGIDDLRALAYHNNAPIEMYGNAATLEEIRRRYPYIFKTSHGGIYVEFVKENVIEDYDSLTIGDITVQSFAQDHNVCTSLGFRFGDFAYSVDTVRLDARALDVLKGVETWIVDGGGYQRENPTTHANIKAVMEWVDIVRPKMTYLTVLSSHMDYKTLCEELPPHIRPAWDGMEIGMDGNRR